MNVLRARTWTWWTILRISIEERLVYRADFALGTLMRFLPIITQILLWSAVFAASGRQTIVGMTNNQMIAYFLIIQIVRAFSSMPDLASGIALEIREGEIKKYLIQPINLIGFLLIRRLAHKLVYYGVAVGPFALVYYLCRSYFDGWPDPVTMAGFIASLFMAFGLGFFIEVMIGMIGFWFLEISALLFIYMLMNFALSGHMFPLGLIPDSIEPWVRLIPLQYLAGFPAEVFLGKVAGSDLTWGLSIQLAWTVFFMLAAHMAYYLGVKRYSGFGG